MGLFSNGAKDSPAGESKPLTGEQASAVAGASEKVKSTRGGYRPGSGRKPSAPVGGTGPVVGKPAEGKKDPNQAEVSEADIEFIRTVAEAGLKVLDRIETNAINGVIDSIGDKYISERRDAYLKQREIGPGDIEIVVNAAGALAAKYAILSRYAPEAAIMSWACIHAMAFQGTMADLKKLAVIVKNVKAKGVNTETHASPPQAN